MVARGNKVRESFSHGKSRSKGQQQPIPKSRSNEPEATVKPAQRKQYTLSDLEAAEARAERIAESGRGNNPNRYPAALREVDRIRAILFDQGDLPRPPTTPEAIEHNRVQSELDRLYPNAESKRVVEFEGQSWQRCYTPLSTSRSGKTVHAWHGYWKKLEPRRLS